MTDCVCDYGEICQAHGPVEVETKIWGPVPRLDESALTPEARAIVERMHELVREFREGLKDRP